MRTSPIKIYPGTGRIIIDPPVSRGVEDLPPCPTSRTFLRVRREGARSFLATYPALQEAGKWHFTIDATWQMARPGFYEAELLCCGDRVAVYRFWLTKQQAGAVSTVPMKHQPCYDVNVPPCPPVDAPCPPCPVDPCAAPPSYCGDAPTLCQGQLESVQCNVRQPGCVG